MRQTIRCTFFYLYEDSQLGWILDEPEYGLYRAGEDLVDLVQMYDRYIQLDEAWKETFRNIFEYDPDKIWPDPLYKDGRFDTYRYMTLTDRETGEEVTEAFIEKWKPAYDAKDWETMISALETVDMKIRTEYVHPENAHFEQ